MKFYNLGRKTFETDFNFTPFRASCPKFEIYNPIDARKVDWCVATTLGHDHR